MKTKRNPRTSFELDRDKHKKLKVLGVIHNYSMNYLVNWGVDLVIEEIEKKEKSKKN